MSSSPLSITSTFVCLLNLTSFGMRNYLLIPLICKPLVAWHGWSAIYCLALVSMSFSDLVLSKLWQKQTNKLAVLCGFIFGVLHPKHCWHDPHHPLLLSILNSQYWSIQRVKRTKDERQLLLPAAHFLHWADCAEMWHAEHGHSQEPVIPLAALNASLPSTLCQRHRWQLNVRLSAWRKVKNAALRGRLHVTLNTSLGPMTLGGCGFFMCTLNGSHSEFLIRFGSTGRNIEPFGTSRHSQWKRHP